jgi:hypothetical protein
MQNPLHRMMNVTRGLDPRVHLLREMDCRARGERRDAVLQTVMPGNDGGTV